MSDMVLKTNQWYEAYDIYGDGREAWYNYFFEIGPTVVYISADQELNSILLHAEDDSVFRDDILDNYEFDESSISADQLLKILSKVHKKMGPEERRIIAKDVFVQKYSYE